MKKLLFDFSPEELREEFGKTKLPAFRANQVYSWMYRGVESFAEMSDLKLALRETLEGRYLLSPFQKCEVRKSKLDETRKYFFTLSDGEHIEAVLLNYRHGYSACISTQAGCRMGCRFCASSACGFGRNLSSGEMLCELVEITKDMRSENPDFRIGHLVLMGIGEALDNYDNVLKFLRLVMRKECFGIGARNLSLSTCGLVPGILRLAQEEIPLTLSVSLHAPNDALRRQLMPIANTYPLPELMNACKAYWEKSLRRISFEYALIENVNDTPECAHELAGLLRGFDCHLNLIPMNEIPGSPYRPSGENRRLVFTKLLSESKINVTVRRTLGADIEAACGQLRRTVKMAGTVTEDTWNTLA